MIEFERIVMSRGHAAPFQQTGKWSDTSEGAVHTLCLSIEGTKEEDIRNLSCLLLIPSSPALPFLHVGPAQGGAKSTSPLSAIS